MIFIFRVCICGCRDFTDYAFFKEKCLFLLKNKLPNVVIVSGGARGVDALAEQFAKEFNLQNEIFKADWEKFGRSAGPRRNEEMVKVSDGVIAFWDYHSKGTKTTIDFSKKYNVNCKIIRIGDFENE